MDKPELYKTSNGEFTLYIPEMDETYHSRHGAITESQHVFIDQGLRLSSETEVHVLEIGMGTGLNALLTALEALDNKRVIHYSTLEPYPIPPSLVKPLNYGGLIEHPSAQDLFKKIHDSSWEEWVEIHPYFFLQKRKEKLEEVTLEDASFDLIYFDAFGPKKQSELWQSSLFKKLGEATKTGGILTTYSAAGQLKRDLRAANFEVTCPAGANGKREMTVAYKR